MKRREFIAGLAVRLTKSLQSSNKEFWVHNPAGFEALPRQVAQSADPLNQAMSSRSGDQQEAEKREGGNKGGANCDQEHSEVARHRVWHRLGEVLDHRKRLGH